MRRKFLPLLGLCVGIAGLVVCGFWMWASHPASPVATGVHQLTVQPPPALDEELERGEGDVNERGDWFTFQRAYPFAEIPEAARRQAWAAVQEKIQAQGIVPMATTWQSIGPAPTVSAFMNNWGVTSGRINSIAISPANPQVILIGSATGGIFRSSDGGNSFRATSDDQADLAIGSLAFAPSEPQIVYAGCGDTRSGYLGSGVLRSMDGGRSWQRVSNQTLPAPGQISKITVDPANANRVYVAQFSRLSENTRFAAGFYLSTDGGVNWTQRLSGLGRDVILDVANPRIVYCAMSRVDAPPDTQAGVYRSTDGGDSFERIFTSPYPLRQTVDIRIANTPANPQALYVYIGSAGDVRVYASTDGGATWANRGGNGIDPGQFGYNTYLAVDPTNANTVFVGARDVFKSTDGGGSWANSTGNFRQSAGWGYVPRESSAHPDQHAFAFSPTNASEVFIGNDGGFYKSTDKGNIFRSMNASLNLTMFVSLATHPTDPAITYGGTQDNGTQRRVNGASQWQEFATGDGGKCVILPTNSSTVFTTYIRGTIYRFSNDTRNFDLQVAGNGTFGEPDSGARIAFYAPFTGNGRDSTLYFGSYRLFVSTDFGMSWQAPADTLDLTRGGADVLNAIGVGAADTNIIYTGSRQGRAMVSSDAGKSWADVSGALPNRTITNITVDPQNSANAYLTVSGFNTGHVFKTTNTGATWTDISSDLPDVPANALLIDPVEANVLYLGTDIGMFRSVNGGAQWLPFNDGLPPVIVTSISAQAGGLIQIGTYGRGAYEVDTGSGRPFISLVEFNGVKVMQITGGRFGNTPTLFINDVNKTEYVKKVTGMSLKIKGKAAGLGLKAGENLIRIVSSDGFSSNTFKLTL